VSDPQDNTMLDNTRIGQTKRVGAVLAALP